MARPRENVSKWPEHGRHVGVCVALNNQEESLMADGGDGASGILGVVVGVVLVIFVGAAVLMATGNMGGNSGPSFTIKVPGAK